MPLKHKAVNWIDGMKISKEHLIQQESFFTESIRDGVAGQLSKINYGLLSPLAEGGNSINVNITVDPSKIIRVHLLECHAITSNGERIEINTNDAQKQNTDAEKLIAEYDFNDTKEKTFYITISVNLFARKQTGKQLTNEIPPRYPYVDAEYTVQVLPVSQISSSANAMLVVGKLQIAAGRMMVVERFIPPCLMVRNHTGLLDAYYDLGNKLGETANLNISIVQKAHAKSQTTSLVRSFMAFSDKVSDFIAHTLGSFRWTMADLPPVFMIENFVQFAYVIKYSLERLPSKDKEELLSYFSEWTDMTIQEINERISSMIRCEYNHDDIAQSLITAEDFMTTVHTIFSKLNSLDFIGKKKGERAFVQERTISDESEIDEIPRPPAKDPTRRRFMTD